MTGVLETGKAIVTNKYFWWVIVALVLIIVIYKYKARIKGWLQQDNGDYSRGIGDTETTEANSAEIAARKAEIEKLATDMFSSFNGADTVTGKIMLINKALAYNDAELKYLSNYYKIVSPNESLYEAVSADWFWWNNEDDLLLAKLNKLNEA